LFIIHKQANKNKNKNTNINTCKKTIYFVVLLGPLQSITTTTMLLAMVLLLPLPLARNVELQGLRVHGNEFLPLDPTMMSR